MPTMAILDDRKEQRRTLMRSLTTALPKDWDCIECPLLRDRTRYADWLIKKKVDVLVADQVLNEQADDSTGTADYKGDQVTRAIRREMPNFPVFIVTAFPEDIELQQHLADVEGVVTRKDLTKNVRTYVPRMVRAAQRFNEELARTLEKVGVLAAKVASGHASAAEKRQLEKMQTACGVASAASVDTSRESLLSKVEDKLKGLDKLRGNIESLIKKRGR